MPQTNLPQEMGHGIHLRGNGKAITIAVRTIIKYGPGIIADLTVEKKPINGNGGLSERVIGLTPGDVKVVDEDIGENISVGITQPKKGREPEIYCNYNPDYTCSSYRGNGH